MNRRTALKTTALLGLAGASYACQKDNSEVQDQEIDFKTILRQEVLKRSLFPDPVFIKTIELLKSGREFIVRVRSTDGAEGLAIAHTSHMPHLYPIFLNKIAPYIVGKDARNWENILEEIYVGGSNYKWQGLPLWVPQASAEFAVLDLLGKVAGKPIGELFGRIHHREISVYQANNHRRKSAEESADLILQSVEESGARAVKYKVGGRMRKNEDIPKGRTEALIPLVRKMLGDEMVIYADSNGSYDVANSVRVGKILEDHGTSFFEEPCRFDHYEETLEVANKLSIPIAGGEQEPSLSQFKWLIKHGALQVVQPDLFYFGGMIRAMKVARMAEAVGIPCTPHISGSGLGYLYMLHFVSAVKNAGPYHEFKGLNKNVPFDCPTADLRSKEGVIKVPTGPGLGIELDPDFVGKAEVVRV